LDARQDKSADEKFRLFLSMHGLHDRYAQEEIFRLISNVYPGLNVPLRSELIDLICAYQHLDKDEDSVERTALHQFYWFQRLVDADPTCKIADVARGRILAKYPDFDLKEKRAFARSVEAEWIVPISPYTADQLLRKPPSEWVDTLLEFKATSFDGPDRDGLREVIREVAKTSPNWSFELATELAERAAWETDLWESLFEAWGEWSSDREHCLIILNWLNNKNLWEHNHYRIIKTLYSLVQDEGKGCALSILTEANETATALWTQIELDNDIPDNNDEWLQLAINRSPGVLAEYWLGSAQLWRKEQEPRPTALSDDYRNALDKIIVSGNKASGLALAVLTGQIAFFLHVDSDWTESNLLQWFDYERDSKRFQQAWDGFLTLGRLNVQLVKVLEPYFEKALTRLDKELNPHRDRFVEYFTALICFYVSDPQKKWIPAFFKNVNLNDRIKFGHQMWQLLQGMVAEQQEELWANWIKVYWERRLQGLPKPINDAEVLPMVEWAPHLGAMFPEAVELAIKMPIPEFEHSSIIHVIQTNDLASRYPLATVKLLVHLLQTQCPAYIWFGIDKIKAKIDSMEIHPDLLRKFHQSLAAKGLD
jgi:hypothetical protein